MQINPGFQPPSDPGSKFRAADRKHMNAAIDEIMGGSSEKEARARTAAAADERKDARAIFEPKGPGAVSRFFSRAGAAFKKLGSRISNLVSGGKADRGFDPASAVEAKTDAVVRSVPGNDERKDASLDMTPARDPGHQIEAKHEPMPDEVKQSLNVTMTRAEGLAAAKAMADQKRAGRTGQEQGHTL